MRVKKRTESEPGLKRFKMSVQKNRAILFSLAGIIALAFQGLELMQISFVQVLILLLMANLSAAVFYFTSRYFWKVNLDPVWLLFDSFLITVGIYISGGIESAWFPWYLANVSGAAFVAGISWAIAIALVDIIAYLGLLFYMGDITGFDQVFFTRLMLMLSLFAASFFFLVGATALQKKKRQIKKMKENESRKVKELTRLTTVLDERTRELADANLKIRHADQMKSQFLANMSHELRTPLNSIIGFSEILISRMSDDFPEKYLKFIKNVNASGNHLLGIINDLLDLSKIEAGKMAVTSEKFPVEGLVHGVCTIMKGVIARRGIEFKIDIPRDLPPLEGDPVKVKQILYNLLSNAVKFSPDKGEVVISARKLTASESPLEVNTIEMMVIDRGIGIAPEDQELIFEEFRQVDSTPMRQYQGTGLGLALVRRFVELHKGIVEVESEMGEGSVFRVYLPEKYAGDGSDEQIEAIPVTKLGRAPRILVVEDDPTAYEAISNELAVAQFIPIRARHGEEALRMARTIKPAAITLDLILPGMDGWEILKQLKQDKETSDIPIIIVSMIENRELGMALGADDYFLKPLRGGELAGKLGKMFPPEKTKYGRALLIGDDEGVHEMIEKELKPQGFIVDHARSGDEGIKLAHQNPPTLIVLDLMIHGMDGVEIATYLRKDPKTSYIPILMLTAQELSAGDRDNLAGKMNAMLQKGENCSADLVRTVQHLVRRHQLEQGGDNG